jgi:hypothetical protein
MALIGNVQATTIAVDNALVSRQNLGMEIKGDFAWKEGPLTYIAPYKLSFNQGGGDGNSLNGTTSADGIIVNSTGYYYCYAWHRSGNGNFMGISLNGDRGALEGRTDLAWGHDHAANAEGWSKSAIIGYLEAGWKITSGPAADYGARYAPGFGAGMLIVRLR